MVNVGDDGHITDIGAGCRLYCVLRYGFGLGHGSSRIGPIKGKGAALWLSARPPFMVAARANSTRRIR